MFTSFNFSLKIFFLVSLVNINITINKDIIDKLAFNLFKNE